MIIPPKDKRFDIEKPKQGVETTIGLLPDRLKRLRTSERLVMQATKTGMRTMVNMLNARKFRQMNAPRKKASSEIGKTVLPYVLIAIFGALVLGFLGLVAYLLLSSR